MQGVTALTATMQRVPVKEGLFHWEEGTCQLLVSACGHCGEVVFPRQSFCPECCTETMLDTAIRSKGVLKSFTEITAPPPGYRGTVPYTAAIVEFPEGIRVLGVTTEPTVKTLRAGMMMELIADTAFIDGDKEYVTYKFRPAG